MLKWPEFAGRKALVVERFDRRWTKDGRLIRLPQEDCCQALSVPPTQKYDAEGGPGLVDILKLLAQSDQPAVDQKAFLKAQIFFWMIAATDGHAKNFSLALKPGGGFRPTPLYDVLSAAPAFKAGQIRKNALKLAMAVGDSRHYRLDIITPRHFRQSAEAARVDPRLVDEAAAELAEGMPGAVERAMTDLPASYPADLVTTLLHRSSFPWA